MVLIYISLMISDVEYLFMNLFCISLGKCLCIFKSKQFDYFPYWVIWVSYLFWIWTLYPILYITSSFCWHLLCRSFLVYRPTCLFLVLLLVILMLYPKYYCQTLTSRRFLFMSSSRSFTLSSLRNRVFPAILVNKDVTVTSNCSHHGWWTSESWRNSGRKEHPLSSSHQTAATPNSKPWGNSCVKTQNTGPR